MTKCEHKRFTFHKSTTYSSGYFECYDCGEYTYEWILESERDEDGYLEIWEEPIWANDSEGEI